MKSADAVQVYHARVTDLPLDSTTLSPDERQRAARFKFDRDRENFIVRRVLLRKILGHYLKMDPEKIIFKYGPNGKPELPGLHFNASHSNGHILIAIAPCVVGVDLEYIRPMEDMEQIAKRFFSPPERLLVKDAASFFRIWSRKEAFLKTTGEGLSDRLTKIDVTGASFEGIHLHDLSIAPDFSAALGVQGAITKIICEPWPGVR